MKLNKIITALLVLNSFSLNASAEIVANVNVDLQCLEIKVKEENPETYMSLRMENAEGEYFLLKQFKTDAEGKYDGTYPLKINSGDYILKLHINGGETYKKEFFFSNTEDLKKFFDELLSKLEAAGVSGDYTELKTIIEENKKYMAFVDFESYEGILEEDTGKDIYEYLTKQETPLNLGDFSAQFNQAITIKKVIIAKTVEKLKENAEPLGIKETDVYTLFEGLSGDGQENVAKNMDSMYYSMDAFAKSFGREVLLMSIGEKNYREYDVIINTCEEYIDSNLMIRYNKLSESKKIEVSKALADKDYSEYGIFETTFLQAIAKAEKVVATPSGSSGGGGSSHSGKSTSVVSGVPAISKTEKNEEKTDEKTSLPIFTDMYKTQWANEAVTALAQKKIVHGKTETEFYPTDKIKREEFLALILRGFSIESVETETVFEDVKKGEWYYNTVATAEKLGIVSGIDDTHFGTGKSITRQEMCVIAHRAAVMKNIIFNEAEKNPFDDGIAIWAEKAVSELWASGIVSGVGEREFMAEYSATRAEASVLIYKLLGFAGLL